MARWQEALCAFRRRSIEAPRAPEASRLMFVLCSECYAGAELVAALRPAIVLQTLGGVRVASDPAVRATLEYGIRDKGVRLLVVCGHERCSAHPASSVEESQAHVVAQCRALQRDEHIGPMLKGGVGVHALWLDEAEGDIYACDVEGRRGQLLGDDALSRLLEA